MIQLFMTNSTCALVLLSLLFLAIGSFLNVVIYRLPLMLQSQWQNECRALLHLPNQVEKKLSLSIPRSHCPQCKHVISVWHNIPLLSFCLLRGRCAYCKARISWQYPMIELITMVLSLFAAIHFGFNITLIYALLFIWCMICLTKIDIEHQILPDGLVLSLLWIGLIANTNHQFISPSNAVLTAAGAYLGLWIFIKVFELITGKIGMGHGDLKLFAALGAWFGWTSLPLVLLISSILGTLIGLTYLKLNKKTKDTPIAFGPFLCIAGLVTLFYGQSFWQWYLFT